MTLEGAVVKEQGVTFAIVIVKQHTLSNSSSAGKAAASFGPLFPGLPIVLMAQDSHGTPTYWGRPDIVRFLAGVSISRIPWKKYTFA
jgi:hypothetical protein